MPLYTENQMEQKTDCGYTIQAIFMLEKWRARTNARTHAHTYTHTHTGVPYRDTQINPNTVLGVTRGTKETR